MGQKYKFFIKGKVVIFNQAAEFGMNRQEKVTFWLDRLTKLELDEDETVEFSDLNGFMQNVKHSLEFIRAAGGYILNPLGELLVIHRRGWWDLPKGKQDQGESLEDTAVREVEEECGIGEISIVLQPFITHHLYSENEKTCLKETYWYRMITPQSGEPVPQTEEGINRAEWRKLPLPATLLEGSYPAIREVIGHFSESPGTVSGSV